jgi:hypothetical protein
LKRYTTKKGGNGPNNHDYYIGKEALKKMSENLKKLHDDIMEKEVPVVKQLKIVQTKYSKN